MAAVAPPTIEEVFVVKTNTGTSGQDADEQHQRPRANRT